MTVALFQRHQGNKDKGGKNSCDLVWRLGAFICFLFIFIFQPRRHTSSTHILFATYYIYQKTCLILPFILAHDAGTIDHRGRLFCGKQLYNKIGIFRAHFFTAKCI